MRNSKYIFFLLHVLLFSGALAFKSLSIFFVFAALAGIIPRKRKNFGYFILAAIIAVAAILVINFPEVELNVRLSNLLGVAPFPFWALVALASIITLSLTALAVNRMVLPSKKRRVLHRSGRF